MRARALAWHLVAWLQLGRLRYSAGTRGLMPQGTEPLISDGVTMIPVRAIVKSSGRKDALYGGAVGRFEGGYLKVYGAFGLVFLVVFLTLVLLGIRCMSKHGQWPVACGIIGWLAYSCGENVLHSPGFFPAVLAWGVAVGVAFRKNGCSQSTRIT